jgi:hypothetical protein
MNIPWFYNEATTRKEVLASLNLPCAQISFTDRQRRSKAAGRKFVIDNDS